MILAKTKRGRAARTACRRSAGSSNGGIRCRSLSNVLLERSGGRARRSRHRSRDPDHRAQRDRRQARDAGDHRRRAQAAGHPARAARRRRGHPRQQQDKRAARSRPGKSRFNLQTLPAEDFPRLARPAGDAADAHAAAEGAARACSRSVQFAMAQQDIRYYLNGMLLVVDEGTLQAGRDRRPPAVVREPRARRRLHAPGSDPAAQDGARARASCSPTATTPVTIDILANQVALPLRQHRARLASWSTASFPTTTA